jgi:hypothetical protein
MFRAIIQSRGAIQGGAARRTFTRYAVGTFDQHIALCPTFTPSFDLPSLSGATKLVGHNVSLRLMGDRRAV